MMISRIVAMCVAVFWWGSAFAADQQVDLKWSDLVPAEGHGTLLQIADNQDIVGELDIADFAGREDKFELIQQYLDRQRALQPGGSTINAELDGRDIKISRYAAPITIINGKLIDFLLVPFHGACIHYPPPPANQIIYVKNAEGMDLARSHLPIVVKGQLSAKPVATAIADVGYQMLDVTIEEYAK
ncbi:MAG: DUF3299 domain-containing protein [Pseudomonadota bacterium]